MAGRRKRSRKDWPKGLRKIRSHYYWEAYDGTRQPTRKKVPLDSSGIEDAKREAILLQARFDEGAYDPWHEPYHYQATVQSAFDDYLKAHGGQAETTLRNKRSLLSRLAKAWGPAREIRSVTASDVAAFVEAQEWAESTTRATLVRLGGILAWLRDEGYLDSDPVATYKRERERKSRGRRTRSRSRRRAAFAPEVRRITEAMRAHDRTSDYSDYEPVARAVAFAAATGLRRSELCHLCRRDVHLRRVGGQVVAGQVRIRAWSDGLESWEPKNARAERTVPLTPRAALLLHAAREEQADEDEYAPALPASGGGRLVMDYLSERFKHFREEVGLSDRYTLHSTRHGYISTLLMLRVSPYLVRQIAGHADLRTQSRYAHLAEEHMTGRPSEARIEALQWLCPGVPTERLQRLVGSGSSWRAGRIDVAHDTQHIAGIEEALFGGALYREEERVR